MMFLKAARTSYYNGRYYWKLDFPKVTISSQTEIGQTEVSIKVPNQRVYTGRKPVIPSSLADIPCSTLGIQNLLYLLNSTLRTSYTLDTRSDVSLVLKDCIAHNYDFGTAYGLLRPVWCEYIDNIQTELQDREAEDITCNRVVPWWCYRVGFRLVIDGARPISHAWVDEVDRINVWMPINGCQWPVPIPKGANLDLIRIEMLNLGVEYAWLDVLCLRQKGGPREDLRVEEWKVDVPTIGVIYKYTHVVCYLSGLGLPLSLKEGDLESDRSWFRCAWTLQEVGSSRIIAGEMPDGPMNAKPIDEKGNYEDKILTEFHKQLDSTRRIDGLYGALSAMQHRVSTYPIDKVAGLAYSLRTRSIPAYYESQSLEDAWTALVNVMNMSHQSVLFFMYPEPGTGRKKWRPSWKQVMEKPLPKVLRHWEWHASVRRNDDDWFVGHCIERGFVHGLAVGGEEGINQCGELVVEDKVGKAHSFHITASHQYPIPEDTYTLLGDDPYNSPQHWVVGRRLPNKMFEKVSVFEMNDPEIKRINKLGLSAKSHSGILA
ncbi:hypothetical protein IW261DRAFT_1629338 [Armillaria novae-zelandiae]|uniref:Heterokaryon incompatibility domain-containing protein n=1 Tax=Armillaria novae-zelandiae TaxID=153914 RepID=A0AA39P6E2_9AGAR|nr:hypothetical protein IW261DRAFT_1629338 [Armillaria novae-zelandiae]